MHPPAVPLASVPDGSEITLDHILAASAVASRATGWRGESLIPTPRAWRINLPAERVRVECGMPLHVALSDGLTLDDREFEISLDAGGPTVVEVIAGFGSLDAQADLGAALTAASTTISALNVAQIGECWIIEDEIVWLDPQRAVVRPDAKAHEAGVSVWRVVPDPALATTVLRLASRLQAAERRAGWAQGSQVDPAQAAAGALTRDLVTVLGGFQRPIGWGRAIAVQETVTLARA